MVCGRGVFSFLVLLQCWWRLLETPCVVLGGIAELAAGANGSLFPEARLSFVQAELNQF